MSTWDSNDCDWLTLTIFKGQTKVYQHTETPWPSDVILILLFRKKAINLGRSGSNPLIEVTMKVKGDEQQDFFGLLPAPGAFSIELGESGTLQLPVDPASWEDTFQEGGELGATPAEDTPGFTLVVASAAIAMAAFINQRRPETEE